jgi:iron complex outermembrane receptor protein
VRKVVVFVLLLFSFGGLFAQKADSCQYELSGVLLDADTKEPLPYVQVRIKDAAKVSITDEDGMFRFSGLCEETNTLIISCFGYCDTTCEHFHHHGKDPHIFLRQRVESIIGLLIEVESSEEEGTESISQKVLDKEELSQSPTQSLASAISQVDGVTLASSGSNVQLPVIHGLYGNRILILNNGLKHGFQNWGVRSCP